MDKDEQRRRAITAWWERKSIRDFIARLRDKAKPEQSTNG